MPTSSVKEYFADVTDGLVDIDGEVLGPLTMPQPLAWCANSNSGIGQPSGEPRAQCLARHAVLAADPLVDLSPYDNDGNGYVDAFVVVHASRGAEETGDGGDIWSHKWVLPEERAGDGAEVFAYPTISEDAELGVSAHGLGHLVLGFPNLYDTDHSSAGVGSWCLMSGGSWNGGGDTPAHRRRGARRSRAGGGGERHRRREGRPPRRQDEPHRPPLPSPLPGSPGPRPATGRRGTGGPGRRGPRRRGRGRPGPDRAPAAWALALRCPCSSRSVAGSP